MHYLALIYLSLNLYMFRACYLSSGVVHRICIATGTFYTLGYITYQLLYIYSVQLLMMGNICPKHVVVR
jgi:hypothetical protein